MVTKYKKTDIDTLKEAIYDNINSSKYIESSKDWLKGKIFIDKDEIEWKIVDFYGKDRRSYIFLKKKPFRFFSKMKSYTFVEFIKKIILKDFVEKKKQ